MSALQIVFGAILGVVAIIIIAVVLLQESRQAGISGAISGGGGDSFLGKNKARTREAFFEKSTKFIAILFFALTIALDCIILFVK